MKQTSSTGTNLKDEEEQGMEESDCGGRNHEHLRCKHYLGCIYHFIGQLLWFLCSLTRSVSSFPSIIRRRPIKKSSLHSPFLQMQRNYQKQRSVDIRKVVKSIPRTHQRLLRCLFYNHSQSLENANKNHQNYQSFNIPPGVDC